MKALGGLYYLGTIKSWPGGAIKYSFTGCLWILYQSYLCSKKARKRYASRELVDSTGRETADEGKGFLDTSCQPRPSKVERELKIWPVADPYRRIWLFCIWICLLSNAYYCMSNIWPIYFTEENIFSFHCSHWSIISTFNLFIANVFIYYVDILCLKEFSKRASIFPMDGHFDWPNVLWICSVPWSILWDDNFRNSNFVGVFIPNDWMLPCWRTRIYFLLLKRPHWLP